MLLEGGTLVSNTRSQPTAQRPVGYGEPQYAEPAPSAGAAAGTVLAGVLMMLGGAWDFGPEPLMDTARCANLVGHLLPGPV